jgi:Carbohydrate esterase, sialic acid-specific acetylesterase
MAQDYFGGDTEAATAVLLCGNGKKHNVPKVVQANLRRTLSRCFVAAAFFCICVTRRDLSQTMLTLQLFVKDYTWQLKWGSMFWSGARTRPPGSMDSLTIRGAGQKPLKVILLAGQSNMVGFGSIEHLMILMNGTVKNEYTHLWNQTSNSFVVRPDVYMQYNSRLGPLTVGTGFAATNCFGPELGLGMVLGDLYASAFNETIVLIKSAYGGKSLAIDFRPPSAGIGNYSQKVRPSQYGYYYRLMIQDFQTALQNLDKIYPDYDSAAGYELAGFVWFQGWNDMLEWEFVNDYASNLAHFIRDVRADLELDDQPSAIPFIVGELGMGGVHPTGRGSDRILAMEAAQRVVTLLPEFIHNSQFVPTAKYAVVDDPAHQYNGVYHYYGRADTYYHIGQAMGLALLKFLIRKDRVRGENLD